MSKIYLAICALFLFSCSAKKDQLKVIATPIPHAEMLEFIKPDLKAQGIDLSIIITNDYNVPNRAVNNKEANANFFQHRPFLDAQIKEFHYQIQSIAAIELEPMGIYSKKVTRLADLPKGALIAIPNDPSNEGRALLLLQAQGLIELKDPSDLKATPLSIKSNPKGLKFKEIDAAMLPRTLQDVDAAAINTNYALAAGLSPEKDALVLESKESPYANLLVVRTDEATQPQIEALKAALTSEKMRAFILEHYHGAVLPAF